MYQGSCLCGTVRYEITGEIGPISLCHCSRCRKANGSAFLAAAQIPASEFKVVAGNESLGDFESSPGVHRLFCRNCGSPINSRTTWPSTPERRASRRPVPKKRFFVTNRGFMRINVPTWVRPAPILSTVFGGVRLKMRKHGTDRYRGT
jgi:hypothetical protein